MEAWVHVFSKFTPEALLFEALAICVLGAAYSAFWILRKRRFGSAGADVPSPVVRAYLNELIGDAQTIRQQLFGLIKPGEIPTGSGPSLVANWANSGAGAGAMDGSTTEKVAALEAKMAEQSKAYDTLIGEKQKIEEELASARIAGEKASADGAAKGADNSLVDELKNKIAALEGKLAEYSVIEDDLANLKRLQQENIQLKSQLAGKPAAPAAPAPEPAAPAPAAAAVAAPAAMAAPPAAAAADPLAALGLDNLEAPDAVLDAVSAPAASPSGASVTDPLAAADLSASAAPAADAGFDALAGQVEQSLQPSSAPAAEAPPASAGPEKSDADLVAEFEKMLNG